MFIGFYRSVSDLIRLFYAVTEERGMNITASSPVSSNIRAKIRVAVDTAVRAGVISAYIVAFGAAAVLPMPVSADVERYARDPLDQRSVNAAVMLNSVP